MIALMGSSGAGKSTLMDVISKRKTVGIVEGLILFDGHEPSHAEIGRDTGYVEQKDTLWGTFTVREMIMYTALLKMSSKFSRAQKSARVDEVIDQMGLTKSKNTKIGGAMTRGVSGGEAKRISIALGLLNNPRVLFLDEPTSGLDSATSLDVMGTVKDLALEGRTVLTTIHQPSGKIFSFYDGIILLSRDVDTRSGNIVYFGEAGKVLKGYFEDQGFEYDGEVDPFDGGPYLEAKRDEIPLIKSTESLELAGAMRTRAGEKSSKSPRMGIVSCSGEHGFRATRSTYSVRAGKIRLPAEVIDAIQAVNGVKIGLTPEPPRQTPVARGKK